jgi:transposase
MSGYNQEKSFTVVAEARRKWTKAEKQAIVAEIAATSVSAVARKHGIASSLLW